MVILSLLERNSLNLMATFKVLETLKETKMLLLDGFDPRSLYYSNEPTHLNPKSVSVNGIY